MSKKLRDEWLYVAPNIKGRRHIGIPQIIDERTDNPINYPALEGKILIYERQVEGWFLEPAKKLLRKNGISNAGFILLLIGTSYIEGAQAYREGINLRNTDGAMFRRGVIRLFGLTEDQARGLYDQLRCGLFHTGMTRDMVIISSEYNSPISLVGGDIRINHKLFIKTIN
jgi:hypothetical protein